MDRRIVKQSRIFLALIGILILFACSCKLVRAADLSPFLVKPYLQLGDNPKVGDKAKEELFWISRQASAPWSVEIKSQDSGGWRKAGASVKVKNIKIIPPGEAYLLSCGLCGLEPGKIFQYRVLQGDKPVFEGETHAPNAKDAPYQFAVFGDLANGGPDSKKIVFHCYKEKPDFLVVAGDIVYQYGLASEYLSKFFPICNAEAASPVVGAPLIRSILSFGVLGNHDIAMTPHFNGTDLDRFPDALSYFLFWSEPLNGPQHRGDANTLKLAGSSEAQADFCRAADGNFPKMANYSFDYGNSHWLALDGNPYMNWLDPKLRKWVANDLARAQNATWRFVVFHQPPFSVDSQHAKEQRMRLLVDLFEQGHVDVVFSGHAHNYQRSYPLTFKVQTHNGAPYSNADGTVDGAFNFDKQFDGVAKIKPNGIIYIVTGGGGAPLYDVNPDMQSDPAKRFTCKFEAKKHSFTFCTIDDKKLTVRQISADGELIDHFTIGKDQK